MSIPVKKQYKKAGPNDKRHLTSKSNLQKARERKLEMLKKGKQKEEEEKAEPVSDYDSDSDSSDDSDYIVIAPKNKKKGSGKKAPEKKEDASVREELNLIKQMLSQKKRSSRKKQVIKIVNPAPAPIAPVVPIKDADMDYFKKLLLSQIK